MIRVLIAEELVRDRGPRYDASIPKQALHDRAAIGSTRYVYEAWRTGSGFMS